MKQISFIKLLNAVAILTLSIGFVACEKDKNNAEELITRVELHDHANGPEYRWDDPSGSGNPKVDTVRLKVGQKVEFDLHLYDGNTEITQEIRKEDLDHLVIYAPQSGSLQITTLDRDSKGKPLGLKSEWNPTAAIANTTVQIKLKHEPDKNAADPGATGATEVDVTFPVVITQ